MKLTFMAFILIAVSIHSKCDAQMLNKKFIRHHLDKREKVFSKEFLQDPSYAGKPILLLTPSFPLSFSRLEQDSSRTWRIGPQVALGASYRFVFGKGYKNVNETVQVEPYFMLGITVDGGFSQNLQASGIVGNFNTGGVLRIYKYFNFLFSYDVVTQRPAFGVRARVDLFTFTQSGGSIILNSKDFFKN